MKQVLVTGGSGFVAGHIIAKLLEEGYEVASTVRDARRGLHVKNMLRSHGVARWDTVSFIEADLVRDEGWVEAAAGCHYILHVASPFPRVEPKDENDVIVPAREGTLRILRAARDAGVKRIVLTSSFAAVGYGHEKYDKVFDETDWTNPDGPEVQPYIKSKTLAERAAWDFVAREGGSLELSVVNPVGILGPVMGPDIPTSIWLIKQILDGVQVLPPISFGTVDVRDLADLHIRAMTAESAKGQRFIAVGGRVVTLLDIARTLKDALAGTALEIDIPTMERGASGPIRNTTSLKAERMLGWRARPQEDTFMDAARSLLYFGLIERLRR